MWFSRLFKKNNRPRAGEMGGLFIDARGSREYFELDGKYRYTWVSESLGARSAKEAQPNGDEAIARERYLGNALTLKKIITIGACAWLLLALLAVRVGFLQLGKGRDYLLAAENNRFRYYAQPAQRGIIYDRNGEALVENKPSFSISIAPRDVLPHPVLRQKIMGLLNIPMEEMDALLAIPSILDQESIVLKENISYEDVVRIRVGASDIPGLFVQHTSYRSYALDRASSLSHVLGYVGKMSAQEWEDISQHLENARDRFYEPTDAIGKQGIEKSYEQVLRGVFGKTQVEVDARGQHVRQITSVHAIAGESVILTLDLGIQEELERIMRAWMERLKKTRASAVAIDPRNGEVLGLISLPGFDSNQFARSIPREMFNTLLQDPDRPLFQRAIAGQYPPGSTIKPFVASAALQEGIITPSTAFLSTGGIWMSRWFFKDWLAGGHGLTDVRKAIADSVNTFFYIIGGGYKDHEGLGPERISAYLQQFGFGSKTGIDLPGEGSAFIPTPAWKKETRKEPWYIGDTYNFSIGQGDLLVTPLQLAAGISAVANGGTLYRPHLVRGIAQDGAVPERLVELQTILNAHMVDPQHLQVIREGMRRTTVSGSARSLGTLPVAVAGKTGTAQWNHNQSPHAWFESFAPYENPRIALVVMVEEGAEGSAISAGIAREFYAWWAKNR